MPFDRLAVLLPCHSLENLDLRRGEHDAEQLLSAWSVLWHPALLAVARSIPRWIPAGSPPPGPSDHLIVLPDCAEAMLPEGWLSSASSSGGCVLRNLPDRDAMLAAALDRLPGGGPRVDPDLAADFLALGFCHLSVELLTRKLRYMSNLDTTALESAAVSAAASALTGDADAARRHLQSAFDRLHEARDFFYPAKAWLLDLTLVASTTLGPPLGRELARSGPHNLLVSGDVIDEASRRDPAAIEAMHQALSDGRAELLGGEYSELPLPLLGPEEIDSNLRRGLAAYQRHLGQRPAIYGRRRFGLTPALPQILKRRGFSGALHATLDDGRYPVTNTSRIEWEGLDGTAIDAVGCVPIDAGRAESFLRLAEPWGDAASLDPAAVTVFAHWPGRASRWYDDLRRISAYGSVLGNFVTFSEYLEATRASAQRRRYAPDEYRSPYLVQDAAASGCADPISCRVRHYEQRAAEEAAATVRMLAEVSGTKGEERCGTGDDELTEALSDFAAAVTRSWASPERGRLIVNVQSSPQQSRLYPSSLNPRPPSPAPRPLPPSVPAMGFAWVAADAEPLPSVPPSKGWFGRRKALAPPSVAEQNLLRNEFFEVRLDPATGGIRSIFDLGGRHPRLAQQIALRTPRGNEADDEANYSRMAADEIIVTSTGPTFGELFSRGRLVDAEGRRLAGFRQTTRAWQGSRVIEIEIELDIDRPPGDDPWESYYAARFAWNDATAVLHRSAGLANVPTELRRIESPEFLDLRHDRRRTTLLAAGLPYHRRAGPRKLDTLLVVGGETARRFRMGIGIDVPHPLSAALGFVAPPLIVPDRPRPAAASGWLFHLDCRNVVATHWESLSNVCGEGVRVRLLETDGQGVRLGLRCFRSVASAWKINPGDVPPLELSAEDDQVDVPLGPHQWVEVEVRFALP